MEHRRYHQTEQQYANERVSRYTEGLKRGDLQELYFYANFVGYTITPDKKKIPLNPRTGKAASPTDPETWGTLAEALRFLKNGYDNEITRRHEWPNGLGFALSHTPFTAIDLDRRVAGNRSLYKQAQDYVTEFDSYTEYSPSTSGVHILVEGKLPVAGFRHEDWFEAYSEGRYITLTFHHVPGTPHAIQKRQGELEEVYYRFHPESRPIVATPPPMPQEGVGEEPPRYSDIQVIERALRNAKTGVLFGRLLHGEIADFDGDESRADFALVQQLAYWTYGNKEQIDRIFRSSGLYREKWDEKRGQKTYGELTIAKALSQQPGAKTKG